MQLKIINMTCTLAATFGISICVAQNPAIKTMFTADPAPMVYKDTIFLYTGHDTAAVGARSALII